MKRKEEIEHALAVLGRRMALDGAPDMEVLCCGASMDPVDGIRHLRDLEEISPEADELSHALAWMGGWNSSDAFRLKLKAIVTGLGFEDIAATIDIP
jgi:hypothetical protein